MQQESDIDKDSLSDVPNIKSFVIHPKLIYYINPSSSLTFNYTISIDERKGGEMMYFENQANDTLYHVKTDIYRHNADIKYLNELSANKNLTVKLSTNSFKQHLQTKYYNFEANQLIYYTEISYFQQAKQMNWVVGVNLNGDHFKHEIQKFSSLEDYNYQTLGFFLQHTLIIQEKLTIETGLRFDYHNTYHFFPLPRLSLMYKFNRTLNARINAGLGYKIPNIISNIDPETELKKFRIVKPLLAEYSQGINADINYTSIFFNRLNITINQAFFFTNINQPIFKQLLSDSSFSLSNGSKSLRTAGFQTYSRIKFSKFELYIGYTFTSIIKNYDQLHPRLIATPKHNFSNVFVYEPSKKLRFGIETSFIATQLNQEYHAVRNFLLMAAMIQYNIGEFSFVLNGENLLDIRQSNYERIYNGSPVNPDFHQLWAPIDGRNINFSVKWKLKN
jgi:outer membrane receptor for ferrienterochelin and colicin